MANLNPAERDSGNLVRALLLAIAVYVVCFFMVPPRSGWLALALLPDVIVHEWFSGGEFGRALFERIGPLTIAMLIVALGYSLGRCMLGALEIRVLSGWERTAFSTGIGLCVVSNYTLWMGLAGQLRNRLTMLLPLMFLAAAAALSWRADRASAGGTGDERTDGDGQDGRGDRADSEQDKPSAVRQRAALPAAADGRWAWIAIAAFAMVIVLGCLLPPWEFDVCEYHLQVPKEWFLDGSIRFLPHNIYGNMPLGAEMHSLLAMVMHWGEDAWWWGAIAGKTVTGSFSILTVGLIYGLGRRLFSPAAGRAAGLIYLSTPWIAHVSMTGLIDGVVGFYIMATIAAVYRWSLAAVNESATRREVWGWLLLAGGMAGGAIATKYPPVVLLVVPVAIWIGMRSQSAGRRAISVAVFLIATFVCGGSWYVKNWVQTGNPVYPLAYSIFGAAGRTPEQDLQFREAHRDKDAKGRSFTLERFWESASRVLLRSAWLSPLVIPFGLLGISIALRRAKRGPAVSIGLYLLAYFAGWWLFTHRIDRFWIPVLPLIAVFAGYGVAAYRQSIWRQGTAAILVAWVVIGLVVFGTRFSGVVADTSFFVPLSKLRSIAPHPIHQLLNRRYAMELERERESSMRVLLVGDAQPFALVPPSLYNTCFDECIFELLLKGKSREERLAALREAGITYLFVYWREIERYRATYGYSPFVTKELVRGELVREQRILEVVPLESDPQLGELFKVRTD
ncbi:MAG: phospholipid carrier-dependent glycosyltransferase [Planctomycetes bacterium]|nr:phospholipid carrier-dependent glycosyltransferase [Planctomycetota bacterium]